MCSVELPGLVRIIPGSNFFFIPVFKNVLTISAKILRNGFRERVSKSPDICFLWKIQMVSK
ncbi:hypothetical protein NSB1T_13495 [Coprobacter fastidiosus NSB1 = JCM 33896]|nr:hypothetical protein NSB1T_13495 [Coprobacter fastidiosus NSB1 = JCM 33896]